MKQCLQVLIRIALTAILLLAIGACAYLGQRVLEKPKVALEHVNIKDVAATGATIVFGVRVDNPNAIPLKVKSLRYEVEIGGRPFSTGELTQGTQIPARDRAIVEIPLMVKYSDVFASLIDYVAMRSSTYRIRGEASFGWFTIPFDRAGELALK